jgi:ketosteroid isomerase-like protein
MSDEATRAVVERLQAVWESGDLQAIGAAMLEVAADDLVQEFPQSGERFHGRDNVLAMNSAYTSETGTQPTMTPTRVRGGGDIWVAEGTIDYGNGTSVKAVSIIELKDGKVLSTTDYFASPFEAPEWRRKYAERP